MSELRDGVSDKLQVIKPGSTVALLQGEIRRAVVLAVTLYPKNVAKYQVAWWNGLVRQEAWVEEFEVSAEQPEFVTIGFVVPKKPEA